MYLDHIARRPVGYVVSSFFHGCLVNYNNYSIDILKYITIIGVIYVEKIALPIDSHTNVFFQC